MESGCDLGNQADWVPKNASEIKAKALEVFG